MPPELPPAPEPLPMPEPPVVAAPAPPKAPSRPSTQKPPKAPKMPKAPKAPNAPSAIVDATMGDMIRALIIGAAVGLVSTSLFYVLNKYIFGAALCRPGVEGCSTAPLYSTILAVVVGVIAGVVALAKFAVYRPLPVALAAGIAMWGVFGFMPNAVWYWGLIVGLIFSGLIYVAFAWLARIRSFVLSLIVLAVATVIIRLVIG